MKSLSLSALLALCLTGSAIAQQDPFIVHETKPVIMNGPWIIAPTETSATIVWITDTPSHSKVLYGEAELSAEEEPFVHGLVPIGVRHVVKLKGLHPGRTYRYKVVSTRVVKMKSYWPEKGLAVESPVYSFTTLDRNKPAFSASLITDTHEDVARMGALTKMIDWNNTDFLVHLGDAFHGIESEEALLARWLDPLSRTLAGRKPLIFVRGNHEARGAAARELPNYVPIEEGRFFYARDHGPVHFVILDTGEDKPDSTPVYSDLNRFKQYREEELTWFGQHVQSSTRLRSALFRVVFMHAPNWGWTDEQSAKWAEVANRAGIDLIVSGHNHRFSHTPSGQDGKNWEQLVIGPEHLARIDVSASQMIVTVTALDGSPVTSLRLRAKRQEQ